MLQLCEYGTETRSRLNDIFGSGGMTVTSNTGTSFLDAVNGGVKASSSSTVLGPNLAMTFCRL